MKEHTTTPTEPGWYWVTHDPTDPEDWQLAYWDCQRLGDPWLLTFDPIISSALGLAGTRGVTAWAPSDGYWIDVDMWQRTQMPGIWSGPVLWVGPIEQPACKEVAP